MPIKFSSKRPMTDEEEAEIPKMIAADPDNPEITNNQLREGRPFRTTFPDLALSLDQQKARQ